MRRDARVFGGGNTGAGTLQFATNEFRMAENGSSAVVTVLRLGGLTGAVSATFDASGGPAGTNYTPLNRPLNFAEGEAFLSVGLPLTDDLLINGDRMVTLTLSNAMNGVALGVPSAAALRILDNDSAISFASGTLAVSEAQAGARITVRRLGGTAEAVTVRYATTAGTATPDADYTNVTGTLTFRPGITSRSFTVPIANDTEDIEFI